MTAIPAEQHRVKPAFRNVAIAYREPSARWLLSTVASELAPDPAAWHDIGDVGSSERAKAQDIAGRAEECDPDLVVMTVDDARPAARRILARGTAVLAVPSAWRPGAGFTRIAIGYDGSEPADAAVEATRALVAARDGSALRVEIVHVDDSASATTETDADVVNSRRTAVIEWWLAGVGERVPASVGIMRRAGDPVTALAELSHDVDLVVVGTHGRGSLRRIVGGSVFTELVDATRCPVLIVPRWPRRRSETPLAA
jgi:nucleotide-binding universal stress UspA family protein